MKFLDRFRKSAKIEAVSNDDLLEARQQFSEAGLPFPFIPPEMEPGFKRLNDYIFGAGHSGTGLYNIHEFALLAQLEPVNDYLLLGQAGRGSQSYAMHYYLARKPLYLFLQIAYGGVYTEDNQAIESMKRRYALAEQLIKNFSEDIYQGALPDNERWIITDSDFYESNWVLTKGYTLEDAHYQDVDESRNVLDQVLARLDSL